MSFENIRRIVQKKLNESKQISKQTKSKILFQPVPTILPKNQTKTKGCCGRKSNPT
ncbi:hypothetical protein [Bacillus methanolicus]|uniref:hypothetical protein n=1 Tax=Bacillus methanolicus TaxID=1471 RepID=UPI00237FF47B|nr:hypothetical protein [Bacillus methanolicus]